MISYVIPALNEEDSIGIVIKRIREVDKDGEIIVVDSDSTDRTVEIASSLGARVVNESARGYGRAYKKGFSSVNGDIIVTLDADGTYPPEEVPKLLQYLEKGYDFVNGERLRNASREAMVPMHRIGNTILNIFTRLLFFVDIKDSQSGMWVFRKNIVDRIMPMGTGMEFSEEIKIRAASEFCYIDVSISYASRWGEKKLKPWKDGIRNLLFLLKLRIKGKIRTKHFRCSLSSVPAGK